MPHKNDKITNKRIVDILGQLLMIEDKLFNYNKRCNDCIRETILTIEGIVDSIIDTDHKEDKKLYPVLFQLPNKLRLFQNKYLKCKKDKDFCNLSQTIRTLRKDLTKKYYTYNKSCMTEDKLRKIINTKHKHKDILPVLDPAFNIREVVKNILLLENHIMHKENRCLQCLRKHSLLIEAFLEEAITIDKKCKYIDLIKPIITNARKIQQLILGGRKNYFDIVKLLRRMRKPLFDIAFSFVKKCKC